jgi:hypothetical protein
MISGCNGWSAIFAMASQHATSSVPIATERSVWPPGFSRCIMHASIFSQSRLSPAAFSRESGGAFMMRGISRSRICAPHA